jgi:glucokinase
MLLSADIGGTKTSLGLFESDPRSGDLYLVHQIRLPSGAGNLPEILKDFLKDHHVDCPEAACLCVAGLAHRSQVRLTNLDWPLDMEALKRSLRIQECFMVCNDMQAMGEGLTLLPAADFICIKPGMSRGANASAGPNTVISRKALLAPGTGLGEALIFCDAVYATEGGHTDFAPVNDEQVALLCFLKKTYGHVSYERVLSGPGLANLYQFCYFQMKGALPLQVPSPETIAIQAMKASDQTLACPESAALDLFIDILGAEAGNLALKALALDGVYLGGGIPVKILPKLQTIRFREAFENKGRHKDLMKEIPVYAVKNELLPLFGAAKLAQSLLRKMTPISLL